MGSNLLGNPDLYEKDIIDGKERVRTTGKITGTISPSGLTVEGKITVVSVTTSAAKIPITALADRNSISIHNKSTTDKLYVGFDSSVTADDTSTGGWEVPKSGFFNTDITDDIELWAIATTSITVKVLELA